ncbi:MAG: hypothetical protein NTY71_06685 [Methanoregula sp.]|nr:hypothetical protein [Methanoregula sp.]
MKYLFFILLLGAIIITAGCTTAPNHTPVTPPPIQTTVTTETIPPVVTTIQTENIESIRTQLNSEWRQIQVVYDTYNENKDKLDLTYNYDINRFRERNVPHTISEYQRIKDDLSMININNDDLKNERTVLVSICDYKIKYLQGMSSIYHAPQAETYSYQTSLNEYKNAKYLFQDVRDIVRTMIYVIPYSSKYWEYVNDDYQLAESNIFLANQNISRINKLEK